jgi:arabinose-5-phosphate isomerase
VHPSEAAHGDLGRFRPNDVVIAISNSGETEEVVNLAAILQQDGLAIIAITGQQRASSKKAGHKPSSLARLARVHLPLCLQKEAGAPEFVAPTSSTTATIALGDALALACARARHFTSTDFAKRHPGGTLGGMLRRVTDVMRWRAGSNLPLIDARCTIQEALSQAASAGRRPGALVLIDRASGKLAGIFTDGDLRRLVLASKPGAKLLDAPIASVMTKSPRTLPEHATLRDAVLLFRQFRQDEAPVVDGAGKPVGMLDVQDLVALRLIQDQTEGEER